MLTLASGVSIARAQGASPVGSWRGTSTCVDKEHFPGCHDEQVIYDIRATNGRRDSVTISADRVVNGRRVSMGDVRFALAADSSWVSVHGTGPGSRIVLRITGTHMTGTMVDVPSGRQVRAMALDRAR